MDLFEQNLKSIDQPLAEQLRPKSFEELIGQDQIFSKNQKYIHFFI